MRLVETLAQFRRSALVCTTVRPPGEPKTRQRNSLAPEARPSTQIILPPAMLLTITVTGIALVLLPAASLATAPNVCGLLAVRKVFQLVRNGGPEMSGPKTSPSSSNCTPATPTLSEASALITITPETLALSTGVVRVTTGGTASVSAGLFGPACTPALSQVARPSNRVKDIPSSTTPSNSTRLAGTSSRTHCPDGGSSPM